MHPRHKLQLEKRHHDNQKKTGNPQDKPQPIRNPMPKCLTKVRRSWIITQTFMEKICKEVVLVTDY